jgi:serine/threonine-protein kinase
MRGPAAIHDGAGVAPEAVIAGMSTVGELLAGRYELRSRLGRGGMAEVYRALDRRLGREVAVKILADHLLSDPRSVERFEREGRTAASLNHPNVVDVYDAASEGDTHYLVMELVEGPTLAEVIAQEGRMPVARALDIAGRMAAALQAAHDRGLVHHDVKPSNVLFDTDGNVKVADFGIARAASSDITTIQGSPPYVAPEQARGQRADPRSDVYGLGCVLFEMLAGRPPFTGKSASAVIMQHLDATPPRLSAFRDDISSNVEDVVGRALSKEPTQRYESAGAFRSDIDRVAAGLPASRMTIVSTRHLDPTTTEALSRAAADEPPPPPRLEQSREPTRPYTQQVPDERKPQRARRRPGLQALSVAVVLVLLVLLAFAAWSDSRLRNQPAPDTDTAEESRDEPDVDQQPPEEDTANDDGGSGSSGGQTADRIRDLLQRGRNADDATTRAVDELQRRLTEAIAQQAQGDDEGAADRVRELRDRLDELTEDDQIGSGLADRLRELIDENNPIGG